MEQHDMTKQCARCLVVLPFSEFHSDKSKKFGVGSFCKRCSSEHHKRKYAESREYIKRRVRSWQVANPSKRKQISARYYQRHPEKVNRLTTRWRQRNRSRSNDLAKKSYHKHRDVCIKRMQKWRSDNPEIYKKCIKNWIKNNPQKVKDAVHRRRKYVNEGDDCSQKIKLLSLERFCRWCCRNLTDSIRTIDHVVPLSRGGRHTPDNLVAACKSCNSRKSDRLIGEWNWVST